MKTLLLALTLAAISIFSASTLSAATPEQEKAFVESYKKAFESKDDKTLKSFLYTQGADPEILGFFVMMMTAEMGEKITSIELVDLTPEEIKDAQQAKEGPGGLKAKLPLKPTKKLVIKIEKKDENGSSTSTSSSLVAEKDGKLVIPVPVPVK